MCDEILIFPEDQLPLMTGCGPWWISVVGVVGRGMMGGTAMLRLGVNIDHVATLRQARYARMAGGPGGVVEPDVLEAARECEVAGASHAGMPAKWIIG